jgi:hypothetical protein
MTRVPWPASAAWSAACRRPNSCPRPTNGALLIGPSTDASDGHWWPRDVRQVYGALVFRAATLPHCDSQRQMR